MLKILVVSYHPWRDDISLGNTLSNIFQGMDDKFDFANLYMICTFPSKGYNIENYPAIKDWLINGDWGGDEIPVGAGKLRLEQTGEEHSVNGVKFRSRKKTNNKWFETQDSIGYWNDFYKQKIVYPCIMAQEPCFMLDEDQHFPPAPGNIITGQHLKYLLGFLCSKVCYFALREFYMGGGIEGELKTNRLLILPVPRPSENESLFDELVSNLIENKQVGADISLLDNQIEKLVVEAYHLTDEEVDFIHKKSFVRK